MMPILFIFTWANAISDYCYDDNLLQQRQSLCHALLSAMTRSAKYTVFSHLGHVSLVLVNVMDDLRCGTSFDLAYRTRLHVLQYTSPASNDIVVLSVFLPHSSEKKIVILYRK